VDSVEAPVVARRWYGKWRQSCGLADWRSRWSSSWDDAWKEQAYFPSNQCSGGDQEVWQWREECRVVFGIVVRPYHFCVVRGLCGA